MMKRIFLVFGVFTALLLTSGARAQTQKPLVAPPGGTAMIADSAIEALQSAGQQEAIQRSVVPVAGQPFSSALRLQTLPQKFTNIWDVQVQTPTTAAVEKDDTLLGVFWIRGVAGGQPETGEVRTQFVFERVGEPYTKSIEYNVTIPKGAWKQIVVPFRAAESYAAGAANINFRLGYSDQTIEIADVRVLNYGNRLALNTLPRTPVTYAGRDKNAAWRKAAHARIEKIRKGDLIVRVVNAAGKPVPNATVAVRMQRHAFRFGTAVSAPVLVREDADAERYRKVLRENFNFAVIENNLKWGGWEQNRDRALQAVGWLNTHQIPVRGHNLIWPSWRNSPDDLEKLKDDPAALKKRIDTHIQDEVRGLKGQLVAWDVINEPFDNHDVMDILGNDEMAHWFRLAHATDPKPRLFLNDYPPLDGAASGNRHLNHFYDTLQFLKNSGAPIGGIGFQGHFAGTPIPPERVFSGLNRFGKLGLPISITEFDVNTTDEQLQADYLRDFYTVAFSHPAVHEILMWGFWAKSHWLPDAALWRPDWTPKPNANAYRNLVFKTWWTNADGKTDKTGRYNTRGFHGDYTVTVQANGKKRTVPAAISPTVHVLTVMLK